MPMHAAEVELRGVLDTISNRFYTGGWGFGTLYTDQGMVRITGSLEGHVAGTSLVVRGNYKDTAYGKQLDCSTIMVDSVSGNLEVIRAWLRKHVADADEEKVVSICRPYRLEDRWPLLTNAEKLEHAGLSAADAVKFARAAAYYLLMIELKKGLMEKGFHDQEANKLTAHYGVDVNDVLEADCFLAVCERVVTFNRMDAVLGQGFPRNHPRRLQAAMVQALVGAMRNGHTAQVWRAVNREAAEMAGVYPDTVRAVPLPKEIVSHGEDPGHVENAELVQLRSVGYLEQGIAKWVVEAMKRS